MFQVLSWPNSPEHWQRRFCFVGWRGGPSNKAHLCRRRERRRSFPSSRMTRSKSHKVVQFGRRWAAVEVAELAGILDFACGVEQTAHGGAIERAGEADAANPGCREFLD